jgi:hypothetical protein
MNNFNSNNKNIYIDDYSHNRTGSRTIIITAYNAKNDITNDTKNDTCGITLKLYKNQYFIANLIPK